MRAPKTPFLALTFALLSAATAAAQDDLFRPADDAAERASEAYTQSVGVRTPTQIIQEKAQLRAAQRMGRIAAKEWYGYSQARPRTTATPFTGLYGQHFQGFAMGRPAAHHVARPVIVLR